MSNLNLKDPKQLKGQRDKAKWLKKRNQLGVLGEYILDCLEDKVQETKKEAA